MNKLNLKSSSWAECSFLHCHKKLKAIGNCIIPFYLIYRPVRGYKNYAIGYTIAHMCLFKNVSCQGNGRYHLWIARTAIGQLGLLMFASTSFRCGRKLLKVDTTWSKLKGGIISHHLLFSVTHMTSQLPECNCSYISNISLCSPLPLL